MQYQHEVHDLAATSFNKMEVAHPSLAFKRTAEEKRHQKIVRTARFRTVKDLKQTRNNNISK